MVNSIPVASILPSQTVCLSDLPITLKASGVDIIWYADSAGATVLGTGNNYAPTVNAPGVYSYFLNANNNGCKSSIIKTRLTVNKNPSKPISNNTVVCYSGNALNLRVISNVSANSVMNWYQSKVLSGPPDFVGQSINVNLLPQAIYTYYIYQEDTLTGCYSNTDTMNVVVNSTPTISFVITPINPLIASDSVKISVNTGNVAGNKFLWDNGDTLNTITYLPDAKRLICLRVIDQNGCIDSACTDGSYQLKCGDYFIPNAFSPNGGGHNEVLYVRGLCDYTQIKFSIYDRWGERVFYTITPEIGWDGYYRGQPMNQGVYIYYLIVEFKDGTTIKKTGNVTLVR